MLINLDRLRPNPFQRQVRTAGVDRAHAARLALSMRAAFDARPDMRGLYQPILVRPDPDRAGDYQIADGHHRVEAARLLCAGGVVTLDNAPVEFVANDAWSQLPVTVEAIADADMLLAAVDTALNHKDLGPIDRASAFQALVDAGHSVTAVARRYGLSQPAVSNLIRLLALPEPVRALVNDGLLPERTARELLVLTRFPGALEAFAEKGGDGLWSSPAQLYHVTDIRVPGWDDLYLYDASEIPVRVDHALSALAVRLSEFTTGWPTAVWAPAADDVIADQVGRLKGFFAGTCAECPDRFRRKTTDWCGRPACHTLRVELWNLHADRLLAKAIAEGRRAPLPPVIRGEDFALPGAPDRARSDEAAPEFHAAGEAPQIAMPRTERREPSGYDLYERRKKAENKAVNRRRQALVALVAQIAADATGRAALAENVALLQTLDDALNRPHGWGERNAETDPAALWRAVASGIGKHLKDRTDLNAETRLAALGELIVTLGGTPDPDDLTPIHRADAALLADLATTLPGRPFGYRLSELEQLAATGADSLTPRQRAETLGALRAWLAQPRDSEMTASDVAARVQAVIDRVEGTPVAGDDISAEMENT